MANYHLFQFIDKKFLAMFSIDGFSGLIIIIVVVAFVLIVVGKDDKPKKK